MKVLNQGAAEHWVIMEKVVEGKRARRLSEGKFSYFPILLRTRIAATEIETLEVILSAHRQD